MSVDLSNYDITVQRGTTYKLDFSYTNANNIGIDLSDQTAKMQIRRSKDSIKILAELDENFPGGSFFAGITGGDFYSGSGITAFTGGIVLNYRGETGSIHVELDSETTNSIPVGKHVYDLQIIGSDNNQKTLLRGRFETKENSFFVDRVSPSFVGTASVTGGSL